MDIKWEVEFVKLGFNEKSHRVHFIDEDGDKEYFDIPMNEERLDGEVLKNLEKHAEKDAVENGYKISRAIIYFDLSSPRIGSVIFGDNITLL